MGKLFIWVVIILAVMIVMRIVSARNSAKRHAAATPARQPGKGPAESMVRCAHCGVHLPRSEALLIAGKTWCNSEHARLGER